MKKLMFMHFALLVSGCAWGSMVDEAEENLDQIKKTVAELHCAECIRGCTDVGEICLDIANGACIDDCEDKRSTCDAEEETCVDTNKVTCNPFDGAQYYNCIASVEDQCFMNCPLVESNCNQACGDQAQDCLSTNADCVSDCVQELEDALKGLDFDLTDEEMFNIEQDLIEHSVDFVVQDKYLL